MKNKILMSVGIIAVAAMFFAIAPAGAQAAVSWNDGALMSKGNVPMPCPTVTIGNSSTGQNGSSTCWGPSISASAGDTIKVRINYVNTGSTAAAGSMLYLNATSGTSNSLHSLAQFQVVERRQMAQRLSQSMVPRSHSHMWARSGILNMQHRFRQHLDLQHLVFQSARLEHGIHVLQTRSTVTQGISSRHIA